MGKELAIKGKWKRKWKYRSESLFYFFIIFCVLFSLLCVFFLFLTLFLAWHGIYLCHSVVFDLSYPKMSRISDVGVISYFA